MKKSPLQQAKDRFGAEGTKEKLVAAVTELAESGLWIDRLSADKSLENVSNKKLLHLYDVLSTVKDQFKNREGLIAAILDGEKRNKDEGYKARLSGQPTPRLWDHYRQLPN